MEEGNRQEGLSLCAASVATPPRDPSEPWMSLLILQPSPFYNINCSYCYLPNRTSNQKMTMEVLEASIQRVVEADLLRDSLTIIWHAGEPLAVPLHWYRKAFEIIARTVPSQHPHPPCHPIQRASFKRRLVRFYSGTAYFHRLEH